MPFCLSFLPLTFAFLLSPSGLNLPNSAIVPALSLSSTLYTIKHNCSALTWSRLEAVSGQLTSVTAIWYDCVLDCHSRCFNYVSHFAHQTTVQLTELAFRQSAEKPWGSTFLAGTELSSVFTFSGSLSVSSTIRCRLIVTPSGRKPRAIGR